MPAPFYERRGHRFGLGARVACIVFEDGRALFELVAPVIFVAGIIVFEGNKGNVGNRIGKLLISLELCCSPACSPRFSRLGNMGNNASAFSQRGEGGKARH